MTLIFKTVNTKQLVLVAVLVWNCSLLNTLGYISVRGRFLLNTDFSVPGSYVFWGSPSLMSAVGDGDPSPQHQAAGRQILQPPPCSAQGVTAVHCPVLLTVCLDSATNNCCICDHLYLPVTDETHRSY